jgi:predicted aspartyl protease
MRLVAAGHMLLVDGDADRCFDRIESQKPAELTLPFQRDLDEDRSDLGRFIVIFCILTVIIGGLGGVFYWYSYSQSTGYADVYSKLGIPSLPRAVEASPEIQSRLDQLKREPCFKDAAAELSVALSNAGYPRESASSIMEFAKRCPGSDFLLANAYSPLVQIGDLRGALEVADDLVKSYPINSQFRYWRGRARDQLNDYANALNDYVNAVELEAEPASLVGDVFYNMSRMYAALQRFCDAITPMETYISFNPAERRNPQTTKILAEYADSGHCDAHYASGIGRVPLVGNDRVHTLPVSLNGVVGNFILDTGASYVSVTHGFAARAKLAVEPTDQLLMKTVSGIVIAQIGYASKIAVGQAEAQGVVVAVVPTDDAFGNRLDGLLGMSFLARFSLNVSQSGIELKPIPLR